MALVSGIVVGEGWCGDAATGGGAAIEGAVEAAALNGGEAGIAAGFIASRACLVIVGLVAGVKVRGRGGAALAADRIATGAVVGVGVRDTAGG